jgi:tagatose 1,6-diphosphate aldolase GatY/KbaY
MPLEKTSDLLLSAKKGGYAIGAFNIENMEMAQAVVSAAQELKAPVIVQTTPSTVKYGGFAVYFAIISTLAKGASIPVAVHLDHGDSLQLASQAIREGYTSVMIDGSHLPFEDNIALTKSVVEFARQSGIPVEAELGLVGGKEDSLDGRSSESTDPVAAAEFIQRTGAFSLAVAIGTAHGLYVKPPSLDVARLKEISLAVIAPLVLHGATGLTDEAVAECIHNGISKVNFATSLRMAYTDGVREFLSKSPKTFDPKKYGAAGRENVETFVMERIIALGSANKG